MAFFGEGGGWYKKPKLWSGLMGGYIGDRNRTPDPNARFRSIDNTMIDPNWSVASTFPAADKMPKKKSNKLKYIVEALQELEGPEPPKLAGGDFGRAMPRALGFSLPGMGGRLGEQEAMAKARREEELRRRMKLMGGGY